MTIQAEVTYLVAHCVPHGAFDDPGCPPGAAPRASIEMRGMAFWFEVA